jgi:hypothetical protein
MYNNSSIGMDLTIGTFADGTYSVVDYIDANNGISESIQVDGDFEDAFAEGCAAARSFITVCEYPKDSEEFVRWQEGYNTVVNDSDVNSFELSSDQVMYQDPCSILEDQQEKSQIDRELRGENNLCPETP